MSVSKIKFPIGEAILGWVGICLVTYLLLSAIFVFITSINIQASTSVEEYCSTNNRWNYIMPAGIIACWMSGDIKGN